MYNRILIAADGSKNSMRAAREAMKLASLSQGTVVEIVYIMDYSKAKKKYSIARILKH